MSSQRLQAAERLADLLAQENEALKRFDYPSAVALVAAKEAALAELTKPPLESLPFSTLAKRLGRLAAENQTLLERAIVVQTRLVRIVARAAVPPPGATRYNGYGGRAATARAAALAVSTRA